MTRVPNLSDPPIATDLECIHCGYNLRGLAVGGRCPECGTEISRSSQGNLLCYSDPAWLKRLLLGVRMALWMVAAAALLMIGGMAFGVAGAFVAIPVRRLEPLLNLFGTAAVGGLSLASLFLITSQEPRISLTEDPVTLRKVLRTLGAAGAIANVVNSALALTPQTTVRMGIQVGASIVQLASIVSYFGWFVYMRRFARRIPDPMLVKSTTRLMWFSGILLGLAMLLGVVIAVLAVAFGAGGVPAQTTAPTTQAAGGALPGGVSTTIGIAVGAFTCVGFILAIVFIVWYVRLLFRFRDAFRAALIIAEPSG